MSNSVLFTILLVTAALAFGCLGYILVARADRKREQNMSKEDIERRRIDLKMAKNTRAYDLTTVKVNRTDYVSLCKISGFSVFHMGQDHLYVKLDREEYAVDDFHLGNIIDFLYQVLDMEPEDYTYLDNLYGWAVAQEQDNNESAGEGDDALGAEG